MLNKVNGSNLSSLQMNMDEGVSVLFCFCLLAAQCAVYYEWMSNAVIYFILFLCSVDVHLCLVSAAVALTQCCRVGAVIQLSNKDALIHS